MKTAPRMGSAMNTARPSTSGTRNAYPTSHCWARWVRHQGCGRREAAVGTLAAISLGRGVERRALVGGEVRVDRAGGQGRGLLAALAGEHRGLQAVADGLPDLVRVTRLCAGRGQDLVLEDAVRGRVEDVRALLVDGLVGRELRVVPAGPLLGERLVLRPEPFRERLGLGDGLAVRVDHLGPAAVHGDGLAAGRARDADDSVLDRGEVCLELGDGPEAADLHGGLAATERAAVG